MQTKLCLAMLLLLPAFLFAQDQDAACLLDPEADRRVELFFATAQRAWLEYRGATCELISARWFFMKGSGPLSRA